MAATSIETSPTTNPGFTGVGFPEVFTTMPEQPKEKKPGQLPYEKVKEYFEQGFIVVEDFFTKEEIEPVLDSHRRLIDGIAQKLFDTGRIKNLYADHDLEDRLIMLEKEWTGASMLLIKLGVLTPEFRALYGNERLLNAIEQLIGPEIGANPIWNVRAKLPQHELTDVPWHQDSGYFDSESYSTLVATTWTALRDVTVENGCLEFLKGGHKKGLVGVHECCDNFYLMMKEDELNKRFDINPSTDYIKCPMKSGSVIFFSNVIPHRSVPNMSNITRWGMDFRFQNPNKPWGFFGLKNGITLRSASQPDLKPDWEYYDGQDRYKKQKEYEIERTGSGKVDEFDTTISGPWMEKWEIVQHNKHVDQFLKDKEKQNLEKTEKESKE